MLRWEVTRAQPSDLLPNGRYVLDDLLAAGWEPFAVSDARVWLRRITDEEVPK